MGLKVLSLFGDKTKDNQDNQDRKKYNSIKVSIQNLCNKYIADGGILTVEIAENNMNDFQQYLSSEEFTDKYSYSQHEDDPNVYDIQLKELIDF